MPDSRLLALRPSRHPRSLWTAALAIAAVSTGAYAQDRAANVEEAVDFKNQAPDDRVSFSLRGGATFDLSSDLDTGDVSVNRVNTGIDIAFSLPEDARFILSANSEYSWYDFDGATGLIGGTGDPLDQATSFGFGGQLFVPMGERWTAFGGASVNWSYEEDADVGEGLTVDGYAGANYDFSNGFKLGLAIAGGSRLEDDARIFAFPTIDWQINEKWRLNNTGPRLRLGYKHSDPLTLFAEGGWESREYRLSDSNLVPDGVLRDDRVAIEAGAQWSPNRQFIITGAVGVVAYNQYEVLDSTGDEISEEDADAALRLRLGATFRF